MEDRQWQCFHFLDLTECSRHRACSIRSALMSALLLDESIQAYQWLGVSMILA